MQNSVKMVTTDYNQNEDRISLTRILNDDSSVVVWLTVPLDFKPYPVYFDVINQALSKITATASPPPRQSVAKP